MRISVLFTLFILISYTAQGQCPEFTGSSILPACPGGVCNFCQGQSFTLKAQGGDLPSTSKVDYYIDENPGFNPYAGEGTKIGSANIVTPSPPCRICPQWLGFMIDACGPEAQNEFIVIWTGSGFNTSNFTVDFDSNNNGGAGNGDIGSACGIVPGPAGLIGGCSAISVGANVNLPANAMYVVFTSVGASTNYDFSGICDQVCNVYVSSSACARTIGAFSNNASTGPRTQTVSFSGCGCPSITFGYDTDDPTLMGDGDAYVGGITNNGCSCPSMSPGGYTSVPSTISDFNFTIPSGWCDKTYEIVGVLNPKPNAACCMEIFTDRYTINTRCPKAATAKLEACELNNGQATFDLSEIEDIVLNGSNGIVEWYRDMAGMIRLNSPVTSGSITVYARIKDGVCNSNIVAVQLIVNPKPKANNALLEMCDEGFGQATFDLSKLDRFVNGGNNSLAVKYFEDFALSSEVFSPYTSGTTIIFASTSDGKCESNPAEIKLTVLPRPSGKSITEKICDNGDGKGTFNLNNLISKITGGKNGITVKFYEDIDLIKQIQSPYTTSSTKIYAQLFDGRCYSEPIEIILDVSNINGIPLIIDKICDNGNGIATFDLDNVLLQLTQGDTSIITKFYEDTISLAPITLPVFVTGRDTIYAKLCKGICVSNFISIILEALPRPKADPYHWIICADTSGKAVFDLNKINSIINKGSGLFVGYSRDSSLSPLISNKIITTSKDSLYAFTLNGNCNSLPVKIILEARFGPSINHKNDTTVCDSFILPPITGTNLNQAVYTDILKGGGQTYPPGTKIIQSTKLYLFDNNSSCESIDSFNIFINHPLKAGVDKSSSICEGSTIDLKLLLQNADSTGNFVDIDNSGHLNGSIFNSSNLSAGSYRFLYIHSNALPCISDTAILTLNIRKNLDAGLDSNLVICEGEIVNLVNLLRNADLGGDFKEANNNPALINNNFDSKISGPGIFSITYTIGDGIVCQTKQSKINITVQKQILIDSIPDLTNCNYVILPKITGKHINNNSLYYTNSNGNGNKFNEGDTIKNSTKLFVYATENGACEAQRSFNITINTSTVSTVNQSNLCPNEIVNIAGTQFDINKPNGQVILKNASSNGCDSIIQVNLTFLKPVVSQFQTSICENASIMIGSTVFDKNKTTGQVILTKQSSSACDSLIDVSITILPLVQSNFQATICKGESITINSKLYNENKLTGTDTLKNGSSNSCDSIVNIKVSLIPDIKTNYVQSICSGQSIIINGNTYNSNKLTGTEIFKNGSFNGCDSTVNISLSIVPAVIFSTKQSLCDNKSIKINGIQFDKNKTSYKDTIKNGAAGFCDSIVDISINLKKSYFDTLRNQFCDNGSLTVNNKVYNKLNPKGIENLLASNGCDSSIVIDLSFKNQVQSLFTDSICSNDIRIVNGTIYDKNKLTGTETFIGQALGGCDSIVNISLALKNNSLVSYINRQLCKDDFIIIHGKRYDKSNSTGSDTIGISNSIYCDSIFHISLEFVEYNLNFTKDVFANIGDIIQFDIVTDINPTNISWTADLGLSCSDCTNPEYTVFGEKELIFTFTDSLGCLVQGSIKIHIKDESEVYVPNSFTPNGDLFNDIFKLILPNENYTIQVFEIYSRWGEQLYKEERTSGASHIGWNGSFKGNALSPGVFIYYAKVMTPNGKVKEIAGDFTLIK